MLKTLENGFWELRKSREHDADEDVQLNLGHEDLSFTRRVYVHLDASDGPDPQLLDDLAGCDEPSRV